MATTNAGHVVHLDGRTISLKFSTEFQHVTANTTFKVKGSKVKVTAYVTGNAD